MLVIVDGGATKADWVFANRDGIQYQTQTIGFNPFYFSSGEIEQELKKKFVLDAPVLKAEKVFFYGAGCSDKDRNVVLNEALGKIFPHAAIIIDTDLTGAAKASCGKNPGIAAILGTGSNSCLYDGEQIADQVTNLGFFLGDEGSGAHLGKLLLTAFFYREMPIDLEKHFLDSYSITKKEVMDQIYGPSPNVYLASFAKFIVHHKAHPFIAQLVKQAFGEFLDRHIKKYKGHEKLPVHFIGSIAYYLQQSLIASLNERSLKKGLVLKNPIDKLLEFHLQNSHLPNPQ